MTTTQRTFMYVVGARPNFMKVAPILRAVGSLSADVTQVLVHTGQHFDAAMSDVFFDELGLPAPDEHLGISGGSHAEQTARIMLAFEPILLKYAPDWLVVVGDVNSTMACSVVAAKLGIRIAHVEAGLRSGDMSMPEEVNRRITDAISDLLLTPSADGDLNLVREGIPADRIVCVGNVMIDSLCSNLQSIDARERPLLDKLGLQTQNYVLATLHRPSNVDHSEVLKLLLDALNEISDEIPVVFPVHPRTRKRIDDAGMTRNANLILIDPLGYMDFTALMKAARVVITDSGGVQEETTYLGVPCLTVRENTERPVTITHGTNRLVAPGRDSLISAWKNVATSPIPRRCPELWDGHTGDRIALELVRRVR